MKPSTDRIVALVALVAAIITATGLPSLIGLGPRGVTIAGGVLVGVAAIVRGVWFRTGKWPDWRDALGTVLGVVAIAIGIQGQAVENLDGDVLGSLSSLAAALFAWQRGGGPMPPPSSVGVVLLVLVGCSRLQPTGAALGVGGPLFVLCCVAVALTPERRE